MKSPSILCFGKIPPPIGGVTSSVKSYQDSCHAAGLTFDLFSWTRPKRYSVAHLHYSNKIKRVLFALLSKLFATKSICTIHGEYFDIDNRWNRLLCHLSDGFIFLNQTVYDKASPFLGQLKKPHCKLTSLLQQPQAPAQTSADPQEKIILKKVPGKKTALLYAYKKWLIDDEDVYGIPFILSNLGKLAPYMHLVFIDVQGHYQDEVDPTKLTYINRPVDFKHALSQVDIYIRPTYTDGNSVAVQEALIQRIPVLASDRVDRIFPQVSTYRYGDIDDFSSKLQSLQQPEEITLSSVQDYLAFLTCL